MRNRLFISILFLLFISGCSQGGGGHGTGKISFSLKMPAASLSTLHRVKAAAFPCLQYGIVSVTAEVRDTQEKIVATGGPWACNIGEGTITSVAEGDNYLVTISLKDSSGSVIFHGSKGGLQVIPGQITDAGVIELTGTNNPPVFDSIAPQQVNEGQAVTFTVNATDPDGDTLTYSSTSLPAGAAYDPSTRTFTWTPGFDQNGSFTASFQVTDNGKPPLSATLDVAISVGNVNRPPVLSPIGAQHFTLGTVGAPSSPGSFTVSATDPDGDTLTYDIAGMGYPYGSGYLRGMSIDPATHIVTWDPASNDYTAGEYKVLIRVTDNGTPRMSAYQWVTIQVYNNALDLETIQYPVLNPIGSRQINPGDNLQITLSATDADKTYSLAYAADPISGKSYPTGSTFSAGLHQFTWRPSSGTSGNFWVRFSVADTATSRSAYEDVLMTVGNVNRPPRLTPIGARDVVMGNTLQFIVTATDPENNQLTYSIGNCLINGSPAALPSGASIDPVTQTFTWSVPAFNGSIAHSTVFTIRFTVTDNGTPRESDYEDVPIIVE